MKKKIISLVLVASFTLGLTGCSILENGAKRNKKQAEYVEAIEDLGFKKHESNNKKDIKKGAYQVINSKSGIEDFFDDFQFDEPDAKDIAKVTMALKKEDNNQFVSFLAEFRDEDDAEDYFGDICEFYEDLYEKYENQYGIEAGFDSDDEYLYLAATDNSDGELNVAIVLDGYNVYYIIATISDSDDYDYIELVADLCDSLGFDNPEDYLE